VPKVPGSIAPDHGPIDLPDNFLDKVFRLIIIVWINLQESPGNVEGINVG